MTFPGDTNIDGMVTIADFAVVQSNFGSPGTWIEGDFNGDGLVSIADFSLLQANFGASFSTGLTPVAVPEPSTMLLTIALLGFCVVMRHRRLL